MGADHVVFIPVVLLMGMVMGYVVGQRRALAKLSEEQERRKQ